MKTPLRHLITALGLVFTLNAHADTKPKPDIQRIVATVEDNAASCGVVNTHMTYLDSHGQKHVLNYSKFADNCADGS